MNLEVNDWVWSPDANVGFWTALCSRNSNKNLARWPLYFFPMRKNGFLWRFLNRKDMCLVFKDDSRMTLRIWQILYFLNWIANYQMDEVEIKQERKTGSEFEPFMIRNATWGYRRSRVVSVDAPWMKQKTLRQFHEVYWSFNLIIVGWISYVLVIFLFLNLSHDHHVAPCPPSLVVTRYMWMTHMVAKHTWCGRVSYDPSTTWEKPGHCSGWCEQVMWHRRIYIEWSFNNLQESFCL